MDEVLSGPFGKVGTGVEIITMALLLAVPAFNERELVDELRVTALYSEQNGQAVCLLSYDICEISATQAIQLKRAVADELGMNPDAVHIFCTHTHSSSAEHDHDMPTLEAKSKAAARKACDTAAPVKEVQFLRVDTGKKYNINRRTQPGPLGTWCLMQSRGCVDDGKAVEGTGWVRERMKSYGVDEETLASIKGPFLATRPNDPFLDLVLFPRADVGYAGALVRFTGHPVVCSAGYWRPNLGRDYPGVLCDRLNAALGCNVLFLQGPCGDHRARHRDVGIAERNRIADGLAQELITRMDSHQRFPFDTLTNDRVSVPCPLIERFPNSLADLEQRRQAAITKRKELARGPEYLKQYKDLSEELGFYANAQQVFEKGTYLRSDEVKNRYGDIEISHVRFGNVHLLNFEGELFSNIVSGMENAAGGPTVVTSFADGVTGYLAPPTDVAEGGYEPTWALFDPQSIAGLRDAAMKLLERE